MYLFSFQEIKQKQKAQEELNNRPPTLPLPDVVPDGEAHYGQNGIPLLNGHVPLAAANHPDLQQANRNHGLLGGALANLFVIVGFAAFAYTVKYVLRSIAQEWGTLQKSKTKLVVVAEWVGLFGHQTLTLG